MPKEKKKGSWFKGDIFRMSSKQIIASRTHEVGVKKPTAMQTKKIKNVVHSRYVYKPISPTEFWD